MLQTLYSWLRLAINAKSLLEAYTTLTLQVRLILTVCCFNQLLHLTDDRGCDFGRQVGPYQCSQTVCLVYPVVVHPIQACVVHSNACTPKAQRSKRFDKKLSHFRTSSKGDGRARLCHSFPTFDGRLTKFYATIVRAFGGIEI